MTYDEFLEGINNPDKIKQIDFYIEGYNHYRNCSIGRYKEKIGYPPDFQIQNLGIYLLTYSVLIWLLYLTYCTFYSFLFVAFSVLLVVVALDEIISLFILQFFFIIYMSTVLKKH